MLRQGSGGRIIVIGSVMSDMGRPGSAACEAPTTSPLCASVPLSVALGVDTASKAAVKQFAKVLASELGPAGITVNTIQPSAHP